jgi:peroxiredoxin
VRVFAASRDSSWSHRSWKQALGIETPLLSDWNGALLKRFAASTTRRWMEGVPERSAFLLDQDGTVRASWRYADSEVPDFDVLLEAVRSSSSSP